jgi:hypothetical protein
MLYFALQTSHVKNARRYFRSACLTRVLGAETVSHEAALFDVVVVVAGRECFVWARCVFCHELVRLVSGLVCQYLYLQTK